MQQIFAIALLSIRNAVRSKVVLSLLAMLVITLVILPVSIRGDGTITGLIQIMLSYTLGMAGIMIALTTLWAGSSSISLEIDDKTIQMIATKPVSRLQLWLGKWLGLNVINAVLLIVCGITVMSMLQWRVHPDRLATPEQANEARRLLSARVAIHPIEPSIDLAVQQRFDQVRESESITDTAQQEELRRRIHQQILTEHNTITPGERKTWNFGAVPDYGRSREVTLEFRFSSSVLGQNTVRGQWMIGTPGNPDILVMEDNRVSRVLNQISFNLDERWSGEDLLISYKVMEPEKLSVIFESDRMALLVHRGGFIANFARALLILFGQLALLAAVGVAAGSLFSLPIANFVSCFVLILIQCSTYIQGIAQTTIIMPGTTGASDVATPWITILIAMVFKFLAIFMSPLTQEHALNHMATGRYIDMGWLIHAVLLQGIVYSWLLGWLAAYLLNRRELALPSA